MAIAAQPYPRPQTGAHTPASRGPAQNHLVRARCGDLEVSWAEWGRGEPLVLVHGLGDDHRAWRRTLAWLALHRRVIAYDVRGHGETSIGDPDGTVGQLARDLVLRL